MNIETMAKLIKKYPSPISELTRLAMSVHETDNYTSNIFKNANNAFGIKASAPWNGATYNAKTGEHIDGKDLIIRHNFRKYDTVEDCVADHALFFVSTEKRKNVNYKQAIEAKSYEEEAYALMGQYATDIPSANSIGYAKKLLNTIKQYNLKSYGMKESASMADIEKGSIEMTREKPRTRIKKHTLVNKGSKQAKIEYIAIHFVGASGQALANANYFYNVYREASAHIFIDPKVTYEVVPEGTVAWHVGDAAGVNAKRGKYNGYYTAGGATNNNTIGIEGCQDTSTGTNVWNWQFHPETYRQMILETSYLMDKYNLGIDRVIRHYDASGKSCPGNWMTNDWAKWKQFKKDLQEFRSGSTTVAQDTANPQGFEQSDIPAYRAPKQAFDAKKKGDVVHYRDSFSWFNPQGNKWIISPNIPNWANTQDTIVDVMEVNVSYSKRAYLMEKSKSWILEQDLREPRSHWQDKSAGTYTVQKGDYLYKIAEEFGTTVEKLKLWNALESNMIFTGMELFVVEPFEHMPEDETPVSTDDSDGNEQVSTPEDKGDKTPAVELADDEVMDAKGNIYKISEGIIITPK